MLSYIGGKSKIGKWIVPFYDKDMEPMDDEAKDIKKLAKKFEILIFYYFVSLRTNNY